jgi:hypothetical protein
MLHTTIRVSKFWLRHFIASVVSISIPPLLVFLIYVGLVIFAIVTDSGLGGPLALPFWMLAAFVASILYTAFLLFPSVWLAEIVSRRFGKWQLLAQIPISTITLAVFVFASSLLLNLYANTPNSPLQMLNDPVYIFAALLIPLGVYWWTAKLIELGFILPARMWRRISKPQNI